MSLYCTCPNCANTDELAMCENALLDAQVSVAKAQRNSHRWIMAMLIVLLILAVALALRPTS